MKRDVVTSKFGALLDFYNIIMLHYYRYKKIVLCFSRSPLFSESYPYGPTPLNLSVSLSLSPGSNTLRYAHIYKKNGQGKNKLPLCGESFIGLSENQKEIFLNYT